MLNLAPNPAGPEVAESVKPFLQAHGFLDASLEPLSGGGNNRVFRVGAGVREAVLKVYFQNPADKRDRFGAERAFYELLWRTGVRRTPEPLAWEESQRLGLISLVDGRKLQPAEVDQRFVEQALEFVLEANRARSDTATRDIPAASEACFSIAEHLAVVDRRVARLNTIATDSALDCEAAAFVQAELAPAWVAIRAKIEAQADSSSGGALPAAARCISPSDFGFHNALLPADGRLRFFDFEYAGWDDPAKLVCDFFCQPQIPAPRAARRHFTEALQRGLGLDETFAQRAGLLFPAYQVKWCCIMLNEFLGGERARRDFARGAVTPETRKEVQLAKARAALQQIKENAGLPTGAESR